MPRSASPGSAGSPVAGAALTRLALARSALDRAAHRRTDAQWLAAAWADSGSRVVVLADGRAATVRAGDAVRLAFVSPTEAPAGERYLLAVDSDDAEEVAYFAVAATPPEPAAGLREVGPLLDDRDAGLLVQAVALANWHATHRHCPRCGTPTEVAAAGHIRRCPSDGSEHYPRTDPAVIMTVVDDRDRVLLGRQAAWPPGRFSTLAGFVEPGESLEQAVRREVAEEVGVSVGAVHYLGSQPWPFPSSLMLGFVATALTTDYRVDGEEISEARWFVREALAACVRTGEVRLPPQVSIARRLIEHWYGAELPDGPAW